MLFRIIAVTAAVAIYFKIAINRLSAKSKIRLWRKDAYFTELLRYIHLYPLRDKLVKSSAQLDRYRWSGHGLLMGRLEIDWQDRDSVLK